MDGKQLGDTPMDPCVPHRPYTGLTMPGPVFVPVPVLVVPVTVFVVPVLVVPVLVVLVTVFVVPVLVFALFELHAC